MTAKRDRAIDIAREIFRHSDADISPEESLETIHRKFPGITKVDFERATNVMIAQTEMFAEDMSERVAQLKALLPGALLENLAGKLTGPFHDAFHMAADECEALGEMTADTLFPTKPDKRKS